MSTTRVVAGFTRRQQLLDRRRRRPAASSAVGGGDGADGAARRPPLLRPPPRGAPPAPPPRRQSSGGGGASGSSTINPSPAASAARTFFLPILLPGVVAERTTLERWCSSARTHRDRHLRARPTTTSGDRRRDVSVAAAPPLTAAPRPGCRRRSRRTTHDRHPGRCSRCGSAQLSQFSSRARALGALPPPATVRRQLRRRHVLLPRASTARCRRRATTRSGRAPAHRPLHGVGVLSAATPRRHAGERSGGHGGVVRRAADVPARRPRLRLARGTRSRRAGGLRATTPAATTAATSPSTTAAASMQVPQVTQGEHITKYTIKAGPGGCAHRRPLVRLAHAHPQRRRRLRVHRRRHLLQPPLPRGAARRRRDPAVGVLEAAARPRPRRLQV